jgi:hypothetical protein
MLDLHYLEFVQAELRQLWEVHMEEVQQHLRGLAEQELGQMQLMQMQQPTRLARVNLEI